MQHPAAFLSVRHSEREWPEDPPQLKEFPLEERILVALAHQPWASASDLAKRLEADESDVYTACHQLEQKKLIAGRGLGVTRRIQRRYVLTRAGVRHVTKPFRYKDLVRAALPLTWQMTEDGVTRILAWLPMVESLYEILPVLWTSGLIQPYQWQSPYPDPSCSSLDWLGVPTLMEVTWLSRGRLHVVTTWHFDRYPRSPKVYRVPILWSGLLPQEDYQGRSLRLGSEFIRCPLDPPSKYGISWDIEPRVAAIGTDPFAAFRSGTAYGDDVHVGSVDTTGALVRSAEASHSEWTLGETPPQARSIGHPEAATIEEGPDLVNLGGIRDYKIMCFVSEFRAVTRASLAKAFHMSGTSVKSAVDALAERGLVTVVGQNIYATQRTRDMLADRDRINVDRLVEVTYPDPEGKDATRERDHDSAVAEVAAVFLGAKMPVAAGWRWVVSWEDGQLVPDLWVRVPVPGREEGMWTPVEIEFSARTKKRIDEGKLRSYRLAPIRLGKDFPILVITGEEAAARLFDDLSGDLTILASTLKAFLTGVWEGPESVWRRNGRPAGLSEIAGEHLDHLRQQTGRSLDYNKPTPELWDKLHDQQLGGSEAWDIGGGDVPTGPLPRAEVDRVANEEPAGPSGSRPVSAPAPPGPSPAPAGRAAPARSRVTQETPAPRPTSTRPVGTPAPRGLDWPLLEAILQRSRALDRPIVEADLIAERRLKETGLSNAERICLQRVRAIILRGAAHRLWVDGRHIERIVQRCLELEEQHKEELRSGNVLQRLAKWLTMSPAETVPRAALRHLLKERADIRKDAIERFDKWAEMVDRDVQTARKARTLE